jgi:hypothetical protein
MVRSGSGRRMAASSRSFWTTRWWVSASRACQMDQGSRSLINNVCILKRGHVGLMLRCTWSEIGTKPRCPAVQQVVGYWKCCGPSAPLGRTAALAE